MIFGWCLPFRSLPNIKKDSAKFEQNRWRVTFVPQRGSKFSQNLTLCSDLSVSRWRNFNLEIIFLLKLMFSLLGIFSPLPLGSIAGYFSVISFFFNVHIIYVWKIFWDAEFIFWSYFLSPPYPFDSTGVNLQLFQYLRSLCSNKRFLGHWVHFGVLSTRSYTLGSTES